mgnify:FL=1
MKKDYTILVPSMLPIHFRLLTPVFTKSGYKLEVLTNEGEQVREEGLAHVHNDTCYPALLVIGQMIDALKSGKYDIDHVACAITQTAGGCRASNYLSLLRKALAMEGWQRIPCLSANANGLEKGSSVEFTMPLILRILYGALYGDALMWLSNQVKPYELEKGATDKAVNPINLYGGTKLVSDKLFIAANAYAGAKNVCFSIVRYGNVAGSRGSVIPFFRNLVENGEKALPITDYRMTRFWISLDEGVQLVIKALSEAKGGETFISKIPSFKITDLAQAILPGCEMPEVGIREGEKLHEIMVTREDSMMTYEYEKHFIVYPHFEWWDDSKIQAGGKRVEQGFEYSSGTNTEWLSVEQIQEMLKTVKEH